MSIKVQSINEYKLDCSHVLRQLSRYCAPFVAYLHATHLNLKYYVSRKKRKEERT